MSSRKKQRTEPSKCSARPASAPYAASDCRKSGTWLGPAFRTGCKLAGSRSDGKSDRDDSYLSDGADNPAEDQSQQGSAQEDHTEVSYLSYLARERDRVERVGAVYRGTAQRNPEEKVQYVIVNEAGASVYSASKLASEEFRISTWTEKRGVYREKTFRILWQSW